MMNELLALTNDGGTCREELIVEAQHNVVMSQEASCKVFLSKLTPKQNKVLQAIAKEGVASSIISSKFIKNTISILQVSSSLQ